jgi:hypothetical protein
MGHYIEILENPGIIISTGYKPAAPKNRAKSVKKTPRRGKMG